MSVAPAKRLSAPWMSAPETRAVVAALEAARPGANRFVGGCVRDAFLGHPAVDIDIATQLTPDAVMAAAQRAGLACAPTGIEHGTITVVSGHKPYEVTTLRRDVTTDGRRATVAFTTDWAEDASRRDFRLNALYAEPDGTLHDPTGAGLEDARAGRIIFIGDAQTRIREDHLRILRFFRFNAWYARAAPDAAGLAACAALKDGVAALSAERVWRELRKLLDADDPRPALEAMAQTGVLGAALPEAGPLTRFATLVEIETSQLFTHDAMTRLAALAPDEETARKMGLRLKLSNEERARLRGALGRAGERIVSYLSPREVRRHLYKLGPQAFCDRVLLAWAGDTSMIRSTQWRALLAMANGYLRPKLPLTGEEVVAAGIAAGPKVGAVLREVEAWWIDADFTDDKLSIVERLKAVAQGLA